MKILQEDEQVGQDNKDPPDKFDFTVMSYNILSQDLLEDNSHLYKHCRPHVLPWDYRFPNILSDIKRLDADVSNSHATAGAKTAIHVWEDVLVVECKQSQDASRFSDYT